MFIYKITVHPINQVYIGLDTKESNKLSRWKKHLQECQKKQETKLQKALYKYGEANSSIEVIHDNVASIFELACLEIFYIEKYDSYRNGLNSTRGGDAWNHKDIRLLSEEEIQTIKVVLGHRFSEYNKNVKWANMTKEERLDMIREKMFLTPEAIAKRTETLKKWYAEDPSRKAEKLAALKKWRDENPEKSKETCRKNGAKAIEVISKPIKVEFPDGTTKVYMNQEVFNRETGKYAQYMLKQTALGLSVKGYRAWFIDKDDTR